MDTNRSSKVPPALYGLVSLKRYYRLTNQVVNGKAKMNQKNRAVAEKKRNRKIVDLSLIHICNAIFEKNRVFVVVDIVTSKIH